jgi:hypothetical protein
LANGLFCKVFNLVPRHEQIVATILRTDHARPVTILIGVIELLMAAWVISKVKLKLNSTVQIATVASMNLMEFLLVPDLLLWGRFNIVFAIFFIILVYYNGFVLNRK